ncbi:MAG: methylated-DNA--[protein]-cysteine S-methyltransferase [Lautropia sp.]
MTTLAFFLERIPSPLGEMLLVTDDRQHLRAIEWHDAEDRMLQLMRRQYRGTFVDLRGTTTASDATRAMQAYFAGDVAAIDALPVALGGTDFQREVWAALRTIRPGRTISYRELAARIGRPAAIRAVGLANGANPVSVVIPCHRVVGADASLTGYGGGLHRKRWLLAHEKALPAPRPERLVG